MKNKETKTPKKKTPAKKAAPVKKAAPKKKVAAKKATPSFKVTSIEGGKKLLVAAKEYKVNAEKKLLKATDGDAVQAAMNEIQAGINRIDLTKQAIKDFKKAEKETAKETDEDNGSSVGKYVGIGALAVLAISGLVFGPALVEKIGNGETANDDL